ncbi:MAG: hypothetical protein Kilf2KO_26150 [Rhodospirillales bacterium]
MSNGSFDDFRDALRAFESGVDFDRYQAGIITEGQIRGWVGDDTWEAWERGEISWTDMQYRSMNTLGFVGYQFGEALLIDLGYYQDDFFYGNGAASNTWDGTWTGKNGADSLESFKTEAVQEAAILDAFGFNLVVIEEGLAQQGKSLNDFIGTTGSYTGLSGATVQVELTLTGILAAAHLRGAWGTLDLLRNGAVSSDENGTSILQYIEQFGGYDAPSVASLIAEWQDGEDGGVGGGEDYLLSWAWGSHASLPDFDPDADRIDLGGVFGAADIELREEAGSTVIAVIFGAEGERQTLTLEGVALSDLSSGNFARAGGAAATIAAALDQAEEPGGETLLGSDGDDSLTGGNQDDRLTGRSGSDLLRGFEGDDRLNGGSGVDSLFGGEGDDSLIGGARGDLLAGGSGSDLLFGGGGRDRLNGGSGADTLVGGEGSDSLLVDTADDVIWETADGGAADLVLSNAKRYVLGSGAEGFVEDGLLNAAAASLTGNALDNRLFGNDGDNRLAGRSGDDSLFGDGGDDRLIGGSGQDRLAGKGGDDTLFLGERDRAFGGSGDDSFLFREEAFASDGPILRDFHGRDFGGSGQDRLVFASGLESGNFLYREAQAFTGQGNSEARFAGGQELQIDRDGDGALDDSLRITGFSQAGQLTATDFLWL